MFTNRTVHPTCLIRPLALKADISLTYLELINIYCTPKAQQSWQHCYLLVKLDYSDYSQNCPLCSVSMWYIVSLTVYSKYVLKGRRNVIHSRSKHVKIKQFLIIYYSDILCLSFDLMSCVLSLEDTGRNVHKHWYRGVKDLSIWKSKSCHVYLYFLHTGEAEMLLWID